MKRMLINATHPEELRVAMVDGQKLYDLDIENRTREQKKANIYKGKITRVEPSLEAAFVDYGMERHGFLPLKEISREYFKKQSKDTQGRVRIQDVLKEGTEVIVQVEKEERGNKGAALTTFVSLAGRYLVLMPNNPRAGGISRRIEGEERSELRDAMRGLNTPKGMGAIVRTAGIGRNTKELQWDLDYLAQIWTNIKSESDNSSAPHFLWQESNIIIRAIRDYLRPDIGEVIIDNSVSYELARNFIQQVIPNFHSKIRYYEDSTPLFTRYQVENQIETAFQREVSLPSGGSIVIDVTEALISIDINSARATKGSDIEDTATRTNLEAAEEIARQLRLRDMGGLVVIDFIDMHHSKNQRAVENRMRDSLEIDRARVQVGKISRFGLLEMSRQRLRPSLDETTSSVCPRCSGQGTIRGTRSLALSILRLVEEESQKEFSSEIRAITPVQIATFLLNEKREEISAIEQRNNIRVVVIPNVNMDTPHFEVQRIREQDGTVQEVSYKLAETTVPETVLESSIPAKLIEFPKPAVQALVHATPAPAATEPVATEPVAKEAKPEVKTETKKDKKESIFKRLSIAVFGEAEEEIKEETPKTESSQDSKSIDRNQSPRQDNQGRNRNQNRKRTEDDNQTRNQRDRKQQGEKQKGKRNPRKDNQTQADDTQQETDHQEAETQADNSNRPQRRTDGKRRNPRRRRERREVPEDLLKATQVANEDVSNGNDEQARTPVVESIKAPTSIPKEAVAEEIPSVEATTETTVAAAEEVIVDTVAEVITPEAEAEAEVKVEPTQVEIEADITAEIDINESTTVEEIVISESETTQQAGGSAEEPVSVDSATEISTETSEETSEETVETSAETISEATVTETVSIEAITEAASEEVITEEIISEEVAVEEDATEETITEEVVTEEANIEIESESESIEAIVAVETIIEQSNVTSENVQRASNDPRSQAKPVTSVEISTEVRTRPLPTALDTTKPSPVKAIPSTFSRPENDPRRKNSAES